MTGSAVGGADETCRLVLASGSPARLATLRGAGIEPVVVVSGVTEDDVTASDPAAYVAELAARKARSVADRLRRGSAGDAGGGAAVVGRRALVLGCDSALELAGQVLGKPGRPAVAAARWRAMRGRCGVLHTGHHLVDVASGAERAATASAGVRFASVTDAEIAAYVATGEPLEVAGAFTIDGFGGPFVEAVDGDPHAVMGLSLPLLRHLLADLGVGIVDLWNRAAATGATPPRGER